MPASAIPYWFTRQVRVQTAAGCQGVPANAAWRWGKNPARWFICLAQWTIMSGPVVGDMALAVILGLRLRMPARFRRAQQSVAGAGALRVAW